MNIDLAKKTFWLWIPVFISITAVYLVMFVAVEQTFRHLANDPQVQTARDAARLLTEGTDLDFLVPLEGVIPIGLSYSPYIVIYNNRKEPVAGNGRLDGAYPRLPTEVFERADKQSENKVTWKPKNGVREAIVVERFDGNSSGYVMVGRSLKDTESRTQHISLIIFLAWLGTAILTFIFEAVSLRRLNLSY